MLFYIYPIVPYAPAVLHSFLLLVTVVKGIGPKSYTFLLRGTRILLVSFYIYPIVPYAPAVLHSFLLLVTVVKGIGPNSYIFILRGKGIFACVILYLSDSTLRTSSFT